MAQAPKGTLPVVIVSGSQAFQRERFLATYVGSLLSAGYRRDWVSGKDLNGFEAATAGSPFMGESVVVVLEDPDEALVPAIEAVDRVGDVDAVVVVLLFRGSPPSSGALGALVQKWSKRHKTFKELPPWEAAKQAGPFLAQEVKARGLSLDEALAADAARRIGADFGVLAFEALKACALARSLGKDVVDAEVLRGSMAVVVESEMQPLLDALATRSAPAVARALARIRATSRQDATMRVCRTIGPKAAEGAAALELVGKGVSVSDAATRLGLKSDWVLSNVVLPQARAMGLAGCLDLIGVVAETERAVLDGHAAPWTGLSARLLAWAARYGGGQMG